MLGTVDSRVFSTDQIQSLRIEFKFNPNLNLLLFLFAAARINSGIVW